VTGRRAAPRRWWLHHSLRSLGRDIEESGGRCTCNGATRRPHCWRSATAVADANDPLHAALRALGRRAGANVARGPRAARHHAASAFPAPCCTSPAACSRSRAPFKVFTPFWRACQQREVAAPQPPAKVNWAVAEGGESPGGLAAAPTRPDWAATWESILVSPARHGARGGCRTFLEVPWVITRNSATCPPLRSRHACHRTCTTARYHPRQVWALCEQPQRETRGEARLSPSSPASWAGVSFPTTC
jgi:deoxyribodipyrimidine photo-lyase